MNQPATIAASDLQSELARDGRFGEGSAVLFVVLVLPLALCAEHLGHLVRWVYPATNLLLAAYLYARRSPWYAGHCVLTFCFVSLVRRLVDEQAGWDPSNPVLLTPYLCCLCTGFSFLEYWSRRNPRGLAPFIVLLAAIAYGATLAVLNGRILAAAIDVMKWSAGPLFAVHLLAQREQGHDTRRIIEGCLIWCGAAMSAYGVMQFLNPPSWDALWMRNIYDLGLTSIGQPEPYEVRVFGTMNSPGSLGTFLMVGIVLALCRGTPETLVAAPLMIVCLALCQYRTLWGATALALVMALLSRRSPLRVPNLIALSIVGVLLSASVVAPQVRETVLRRINSLSSLQNDASLESRQQQYGEFLRDDEVVIGEGLAITGASRRLDKAQPVAIDGALIEIWRALGLIAGTTFLLCIVWLVLKLFASGRRPSPHLATDRAIVVATFVQLPMGSVHVGELGFCAWLFLGMALAGRMAHEK